MSSDIPFSAARKLIRPKNFSTLVKPVGSACNLKCAYCYYLDKANLYADNMPRMSEELLEEYIRQYIQAVDAPVVTFCWHGGEPLLAGLPFFQKAMELQERYKGDKQIENTLQTNGTLVNAEWCTFFRENHFLVGLSLDGPREIHDAFRQDKGGHATFNKVLHAAQMMASLGVEFNILCTVNARSAGHAVEIYRFLRALSPFIQFLPVLEYTDSRGQIVPPGTEGATLMPYSVSAEEWGTFICSVYDEWVRNDVGRIFVQLFDVTLAQWCGMPSTLCAFCETCGDGLVVEHNGDVYSCDHFVYPEYWLGNITETPLSQLWRDKRQFLFGTAKFEQLPRVCKRCRYLFLCHGECPKHRFSLSTERNEKGLNSLCKGYKMFFSHTEADMKTMRHLLEKGLAPALIMQSHKP
ncbi:MAG: anaerobic sulfatase maturase [Bacteroidaceae bacterium]|nr:anaerobic sulfatase maturase [Bacteroidaceae bacterium]